MTSTMDGVSAGLYGKCNCYPVLADDRRGLDDLRAKERTCYHEDDGCSAGIHVFSTDWTIALHFALDTLVVVLELDTHAEVAFCTMKEILAECIAHPTDPAVWTMIDRFVWIVHPQFADVAVVSSQLHVT